jgi:glyoxalase family protein
LQTNLIIWKDFVDRTIAGLHHVTAIAGEPQQNIDFYTGVLGLRLVKLTVNFDDPGTYHLYYGDGAGNPGTIMTFFPWEGAPRGRQGTGMATATAFSIAESAVDFWAKRLAENGVVVTGIVERFGSPILAFEDPDGLPLELVSHGDPDSGHTWAGGSIDLAHAIKGFHSITLTERDASRTAILLTRAMGFTLVSQEGDRTRYKAAGEGPGALIDIVAAPNTPFGQVVVGTVHHIAWRTPDDKTQLEWSDALQKQSLNVSPVMDRIYFHSIYFREPGGALFEIATDPPGFTFDELREDLGSHLKLPPWYEPARDQIEVAVKPLRLPVSVGGK